MVAADILQEAIDKRMPNLDQRAATENDETEG
jgi:hypothetical protein